MTTKATLPAPTIDAALDGGLGYNDLVDRYAFTHVQVGPIPKAKADEIVAVYWDGTEVARYSIKPGDLGAVFSIPVLNGKITDIGDGTWVVTYTVFYSLGGGEESSRPSDPIRVKRSVPGGLDPSPDTPFNENLVKASVSPNPVPPNATTVTVVVPLWIHPAEGDQMVVSWNGARFFAPLLPAAPYPSQVSVTLTAQDVLDAGVGPQVPITWGVHDIVANWSGWAEEINVEVRLEDPGLLLAPHVGDKDEPWTEITPAELAGKPLPVYTPDYEGAAEGDIVTIHAHGTALDGSKVSFDSKPQPMPLPGYGLTFEVPNAIVASLAGSNVRLWYTVANRPDSHSVWLPVVGAAQGDFPVPLVAEAVDTDDDGLADWLDPDTADPAHVTIDYATMARDDLITLILEGTGANGSPVKLTYTKQIGTPAPVKIDVPQSDILKFIDATMDVYYQVSPYSRRRVLNRALGEPESAHLPLRVRRETAEEPLPAPIVKDDKGNTIADGGYLDPAAAYAEALASYPDTAKGDEITYSWVGTISTRTETYRVRDPASPPADRADSDFIEKNSGGKVTATYCVKRKGAEPSVPSQEANFIVGAVPLVLLKPVPDLVESGQRVDVGRIPAGGLNVRVKKYQGMDSGQMIDLSCISAIGPSHPTPQEVTVFDDYIFVVPKAYFEQLVNEAETPVARFEYLVTPPGGLDGTSPFYDVTFYRS